MDIATTIASDAAFARQNFALSTVKSSGDQAERLAEIIAENDVSAPVNQGRGVTVDISA